MHPPRLPFAATSAAVLAAAGFRLPDGLDLEDLIRLGEEVVPMPGADEKGPTRRSSLESISPMRLAAYLASLVRPNRILSATP